MLAAIIALPVTLGALNMIPLKTNGTVESNSVSYFEENARIKTSKQYATKTVKVPAFNSIQMNSIVDVVYRQGKQSVTLKCPDNCMKYMKCEVENGVLVIGFRRKVSNKNNMRFIAYVSSPELKSVTSSGVADFTTQAALSVGDFKVRLSGTGDFDCSDIKGKSVDLIQSGTGDISVNNINAPKVELKASGTGDMDVNGNIKCSDIIIRNGGTGDLEIKRKVECNTISLSNKGTGDIRIGRLDSETCTTRGAGTGDIKISSFKGTRLESKEGGTGSSRIMNVNADRVILIGSGCADIEISGKWNHISTWSDRTASVIVNGMRVKNRSSEEYQFQF